MQTIITQKEAKILFERFVLPCSACSETFEGRVHHCGLRTNSLAIIESKGIILHSAVKSVTTYRDTDIPRRSYNFWIEGMKSQVEAVLDELETLKDKQKGRKKALSMIHA